MKNVHQLRNEALAKLGIVQTSKEGNRYVVLNKDNNLLETAYTCHNVTKNTLNMLGVTFTRPNPRSQVLLLVKNKFMFKNYNDTKFSSLTVRHVRELPQLSECFLIGKKAEWLKNYPQIKYTRFWNLLKSFSSLKELLITLGVTFRIDDVDTNKLQNLINGFKFKNKQNLLLSSTAIVQDTQDMIISTGRFDLYNSDKSIQNIHDELIVIINQNRLESYSDIPVFPKYAKSICEKFNSIELEYTQLKSHRDIAIEGMVQQHCVGSRANALQDNCFFSIQYDGKQYTLQCTDRNIIELKGKCNTTPPIELTNKINSALGSIVLNTIPFTQDFQVQEIETYLY